MSAQVIPFIYNDKPVRTVQRDGNPWFAGKDVCGVLDIVKHHQALDRLDADERGTCSVGTPSGNQEMIIISEAGVYRLVFTSRKKEAEDFKRWLAHDVLPALRKTGRFAAHEAEDAPASFEELSVQERRLSLDLVREARVTFGPARAALLWAKLGLPSVPPLSVVREDDQARVCLAHLLDHGMPTGISARQAIHAATTSRAHCRSLEHYGLALRFQPDGVLVANTSDYIEGLFRYTEFEGEWRSLLRTLPGARPDSGRFAGTQSRATFLPMRLITAGCQMPQPAMETGLTIQARS